LTPDDGSGIAPRDKVIHVIVKSARGARGSSLVEVLVAMGLVVGAVGAVAPLVALATRANLQARRTSFAAVVAQAKLEALLPDLDLGLNPSPAGTLSRNTDGWFDFVDRHGRTLGSGEMLPAGTDFIRRWSVQRVANAATTIVQVAVIDVRSQVSPGSGAFVGGRGEYVRVVTAQSGRAF
jgi:type II secretory pathway pseudopilin PulG